MKAAITYIKDAVIRESFHRDRNRFHNIYPDGLWLSKSPHGVDYAFEYENSSRGLSTHVLQYILTYHRHYSGKRLTIIIKRSDKHLAMYAADYNNAVMAVYMAAILYGGLRFMFLDCKDCIDDIHKELAAIIGLSYR
jgi:hypothetical protein